MEARRGRPQLRRHTACAAGRWRAACLSVSFPLGCRFGGRGGRGFLGAAGLVYSAGHASPLGRLTRTGHHGFRPCD
eukprot:7770241-Pyramimonas_sp.AAC.1